MRKSLAQYAPASRERWRAAWITVGILLLGGACGRSREPARGSQGPDLAPPREAGSTVAADSEAVSSVAPTDQHFRAVGEEPFWSLEILKGKEMRFSRPDVPDVRTPAPVPTLDRASRVQTYHAVTEAHDLRVTIDPRPCADSMSGKAFATTVTVELDGTAYHGCGENVP